MRTIAIILGDNDYGMTFEPLLYSLRWALQYNRSSKHSQLFRYCGTSAMTLSEQC